MAYKNVHKKIQRFKALQLIEEIEIEGTEHGAKYYRLTEYGLYQLFLKRIDGVYFDTIKLNKYGIKWDDDHVDKSILINYEHCALFRTFLFPVVNRNTITGLNDTIAIILFDYLHDCCRVINEMLHREDIRGRVDWYIYSWNDNPNPFILDSLREVFDLGNIKMENAALDKVDESTVKIFNKNFSVLIKLDLERNKAVARLEKSNKQYEYNIEKKFSKIEIISHRDGRDRVLEIQFQKASLIELLISKIITKVGKPNYSRETDRFVVLANDDRFMNLVDDFHGEFEKGYNKLMNLGGRSN